MPFKKIALLILIPFISFSFFPYMLSASEEFSYNPDTGAPVQVKTLDAEPHDSTPLPETIEDAANTLRDSMEFMTEGPLSQPEDESVEDKNIDGPEVESEASTDQAFVDDNNFSFSDDSNFDLALSNDTYYGAYAMWGFDRVKAQQAWSLSRGAGVTIAVIDTGLDFNHPDILGNIYTNTAEMNGIAGVDDDGDGFIDDIHGWDFVNSDNNPADDYGHGTHVSGIAAAAADNNKGIAGIAPDAKILPVKVLGSNGSGTIANVIQGIKYAANLGAKVINMSLGVAKKYLSNPLLVEFQNAVNYALSKGSIVVTAAGNDNIDTSTQAPSGLANTIAVGAIDSTNKKASFPNKDPDLVAPGVDIGSLKMGGGYVYMSGTSMASPYAAGAAALILSRYGSTYKNLNYSSQQIYNDVYMRLTASAVNLGKKGYDSSFGYGLLDAYAALTYNSFAQSLSSSVSSGAGSQTGKGITGFGLYDTLPFHALAEDATTYTGQALSFGNWYRIDALVTRKKKNLTPAS